MISQAVSDVRSVAAWGASVSRSCVTKRKLLPMEDPGAYPM